jgi:hypothetical protein
MSPDDRQPADHRNQTVDSMRIIRNVDNTRHRIAFGTLEAAEGFILNTATPGVWIIESAGNTVTDPRSP